MQAKKPTGERAKPRVDLKMAPLRAAVLKVAPNDCAPSSTTCVPNAAQCSCSC